MFKSIVILSVVLSSLIVSGCARKPVAVTEPAPQPAPVEVVAPAEPVAAAVTEIPATATLSVSNGSSLETISFAYDSSVLQETARQALQRNADWLQANPSVNVTIEGHCDERGAGEYNLALGEQRAQAVKTYLVNLGVQAERLNTISFGEEAPLDPGHDETAWAKNRRAAFN